MQYKEVLNKVLSLEKRKPVKIKKSINESIEHKNKRLQRDKEIKEFYGRADYWRQHWNKDYYLQYVLDTGLPYEKIIALFLQVKNTEISSYEEVNFFFSRNQRAAKDLTPFSLGRIKATLENLLKTANYRVALETVGKYIEENLEGAEPIVTLKSGEKIYDTNRLTALEQRGEIKWNGKIWKPN